MITTETDADGVWTVDGAVRMLTAPSDAYRARMAAMPEPTPPPDPIAELTAIITELLALLEA